MTKEGGLMVHIATISGGKDSVAMCDLLLKNGHPVDYIIFNDTLDEHQEMYNYINKVEDYFKARYNKSITRLKPIKSYNEGIFWVRTRGENIGKIAGLPNPTNAFCEWRRDAKILPMQKWIKEQGITDYNVYIGFTTDEKHRADRDFNLIENGKPLFPLIEHFNMSENDCRQYLIKQEMENPLYRHFNRTGCAMCPYQSDQNFYNIWKHYPEVWERMKRYEREVNEYDGEVSSKHWFNDYRTCEDMEELFTFKDKQGSLFDFSDEPLKDCFCKI